MKRIAISDIHGNALSFQRLVLDLQITKGDKLFLLGDFIDRGPRSKEVFDSIFQLLNNGVEVVCVKGNHEALFLDTFTDVNLKKHWLYYCGGMDTMLSFGIQNPSQIDPKYINFIEKMPYYVREDNFIMVHAGLDFTNKNLSPLYNRKQLLWIRNWHHSIDYNWLNKDIIVHGHSPSKRLQIELMKDEIRTQQYINIDNGCFKYDQPDFGHLCALNLDTFELTYQKNIDI